MQPVAKNTPIYIRYLLIYFNLSISPTFSFPIFIFLNLLNYSNLIISKSLIFFAAIFSCAMSICPSLKQEVSGIQPTGSADNCATFLSRYSAHMGTRPTWAIFSMGFHLFKYLLLNYEFNRNLPPKGPFGFPETS